MVTPAMPTHSCMIWSQITSCTLRPVCKSPEPWPVNIAQYEVRFPACFSRLATLQMSWNSASARSLSSPSFPRSLPRMKRPSSSRPTLTNQRGDSGNHQTIMNSIRSGIIWNPIGNLQRNGEAPPSINERPLCAVSDRSCTGLQSLQF
jgi:hypothetical protein